IQFYPTAIGRRGNRILLYENLLAQKEVVLKNKKGEDIIRKSGVSDPTQMTRDQLAQLIMKEIKADSAGKGQIIMDLGSLFQKTARELAAIIPVSWWKGQKHFKVAPTTHFCMGGVITDQYGETSQSGLFAVEEVAAGAHGANRLGGNALAEVFSMGSLAGQKIAESTMELGSRAPDQEKIDNEFSRLEELFSTKGVPPEELIRDLKTLMWQKVGIIREKNELEEALEHLKGSWPQAAIENPGDLIKLLTFQNMRFISETVCTAALQRTESRGSHYRSDHHKEDDGQWKKILFFVNKALI
ncbi:MAG: FAD-binding protein, partial [Desulfobacteraceae bacterium]|nr:FAD-binding protein [Desulfobacteraceae bacterium]